MSSREEFTAFINSGQQPPSGKGWSRSQGSPTKSRPPQAPKPMAMEQTPLLAPVVPPMPQSTLPPSSKRRGHGRSRSDLVLAPPTPQPTDPAPHPFQQGVLSAPINRSSRPPRATTGSGGMMVPPPLPQSNSLVSPMSFGSSTDGGKGAPGRRGNAHRRAKSDIPLALYGSAGSLGLPRRDITKADLLKSLPAPRWGGAAPKKNALSHTRSRSRAGSDGLFDDGQSVKSGSGISMSGSALSLTGYGAIGKSEPDGAAGRDHPLLQSIGSVDLGPDAKRPTMHLRSRSDASVKSVTTNLEKSALFKGVTDTGRIQLQLPKDSFRLLMDSSLEAGYVYKRKLVDDEGEFFLEFHTVDDQPPDGEAKCQCCINNEKRLPPDLYVMSVDSSIYRRMLDEVIRSKTMPCGTFFCGHHEDVRHPDITIAALVVSVVFFLLLAATMMFS